MNLAKSELALGELVICSDGAGLTVHTECQLEFLFIDGAAKGMPRARLN